jgi:hypothetical protein
VITVAVVKARVTGGIEVMKWMGEDRTAILYTADTSSKTSSEFLRADLGGSGRRSCPGPGSTSPARGKVKDYVSRSVTPHFLTFIPLSPLAPVWFSSDDVGIQHQAGRLPKAQRRCRRRHCEKVSRNLSRRLIDSHRHSGRKSRPSPSLRVM